MARIATFSGGCSVLVNGEQWNKLCLDVVEFQEEPDFFTVESNGTVRFLRGGYYRFSSFTQANVFEFAGTRLVKNGEAVAYEYKSSLGNWAMPHLDTVWPVAPGDEVHFEFLNSGGAEIPYFPYQPDGSGNRVQVTFIRP